MDEVISSLLSWIRSYFDTIGKKFPRLISILHAADVFKRQTTIQNNIRLCSR